jgi:hypothetical protein
MVHVLGEDRVSPGSRTEGSLLEVSVSGGFSGRPALPKVRLDKVRSLFGVRMRVPASRSYWLPSVAVVGRPRALSEHTESTPSRRLDPQAQKAVPLS